MEKYINIINNSLPGDASITAEMIVKEISSLRYLSDEFIYYPEYIAEQLFTGDKVSDLVYYPIDVLELRRLISCGVANTEPKNIYFSLEFAKAHFLDHPMLAGFKLPTNQYGSLYRPKKMKGDGCDVELGRVYIREEFLNSEIYHTIIKILRDEGIAIQVDNLLDIPVLKLQTSRKFNMKKYAMRDIQLTENESKIFKFLLDAKNNNPALSGISLRVAGGWVRDKILGIPSDDIDISVDSMTGQQFLNMIGVGGAHVIEKNPDKSKQLETAKIDLFGQEIDFVNLRTEIYKPGSRIPIQTVTDDPREDAKRRDLTINALFYNIETKRVEDYVGGLKDLDTMELKTPQDPARTFIDDPLRMLRVLRFYSRYPSAKIDDSIIQAMSNPDVQKAYDSLAPERASKELRKMFAGEKPVEAAKVLLETGLYKKVFKLPENWHPIDMDQQSPYHDFRLMQHTIGVMENYAEVADSMGVSKDEKGLMLLSSMLHDFGKMDPNIRQMKKDKEGRPVTFDRRGVPVEQMRYMGHDKASADFAEKIMTEMGFSPDEKKFVTTIVRNHMTPHNMSKKVMGKFLNQTDDLYDKIVGHAMADALSKSLSEGEETEIRQTYTDQIEQMKQYKEELGDRLKTPLLDGNRVREMVNQFAPELVANPSAKIMAKGYGSKPVHFMTWLLDRMKEQQWIQKISTIEQAEYWLQREIKQFVNMWKQQETELSKSQLQQIVPPIDLNKQADASSGHSVDDYGSMEGQTPLDRTKGVTYFQRETPTPYTVGKKVRLDVTGLNFTPIEGRIISSKGSSIIVEWISGRYKGKRKAYDLMDTVGLSKLNVI